MTISPGSCLLSCVCSVTCVTDAGLRLPACMGTCAAHFMPLRLFIAQPPDMLIGCLHTKVSELHGCLIRRMMAGQQSGGPDGGEPAGRLMFDRCDALTLDMLYEPAPEAASGANPGGSGNGRPGGSGPGADCGGGSGGSEKVGLGCRQTGPTSLSLSLSPSSPPPLLTQRLPMQARVLSKQHLVADELLFRHFSLISQIQLHYRHSVAHGQVACSHSTFLVATGMCMLQRVLVLRWPRGRQMQ